MTTPEARQNRNGKSRGKARHLDERELLAALRALRRGDFSAHLRDDLPGVPGLIAETFNDLVSMIAGLGGETAALRRAVGSEGGTQKRLCRDGLGGEWSGLAASINDLLDDLNARSQDVERVVSAVARGDLTEKIDLEATAEPLKGDFLRRARAVNAMVDRLSLLGSEVTRVAREIGGEGKLGAQAATEGFAGSWRELVDSVNLMASNLTAQVREIAWVTTAVARGDLDQAIAIDARGEILELKDTINTMVGQLGSFADEVSRVAREVGTDGVLGGQAMVRDVSGIWKELTHNVNSMASNLTNQVRNISEVASAVAAGDLSRTITVDARGEVLDLKNTINDMVNQLNAFGAEVNRVAREVGVEGKLGGQASVEGVRGTWKDLTDNVNLMASNLTNQVRDIAEVTTAVAKGDLTRNIAVDAKGEILELKNTINTMVEQLGSFADEVTRLASDVGGEGLLGGQADVRGVSGTWRDLTDAVNSMANNLTVQVRNISQVATAIAGGDLQKKIVVDAKGEILELKNTINTMVDQLSSFAEQVTRVAREVGTEGKLGGQASVEGVRGIWKDLTDNVNLMASNLTNQVRDIAEVTTAVAKGDLSHKITVEVRGEMLDLKDTINTMVDQLSSFADEVTRVAREVGTEGILAGQAEVRGVSGTWRELTDNVNVMADNLTEQVRGIARVVTAVANGDLKQVLSLDAKGEIATLVETINDMIVTLSTFADQVTGVARDVGVEGKLGGQADVPGAAGIWRDLTANVNELAGNLTRQVRAIGDVATAVTKGDLTQWITVEARGELALLKDNLNQMIRTLAETTQVNQEQDWLKTNLTRFTRMLQGQRDLLTVGRQVLSELAPVVEIQHGAFYIADKSEGEVTLRLLASYAFFERKRLANTFTLGEGLVGQSALEKKRILLTEVPQDYIQVGSALGQTSPRNIVVVPILFEGEVRGVIELASLEPFTGIQLDFLEQLLESLGIVVATIEATMRTDELLRQSQGLTQELKVQQEELRQTNEELEEKARQLTEQKVEVERKNREVELAKHELEDKASQLALTSRYKSQFLANMSHELRTPLNSLLILSRQLSQNTDGNLTDRQVEYASTVHQSGSDLLALINEILDLAKVESGTMAIEITEIRFAEVKDYVERSFRQIAEEKGLQFSVELSSDIPESILTDDMRLRQILRNLLSNAFKFTSRGGVRLRIFRRHEDIGLLEGHELDRADSVIGFAVEDTGIGIPQDKQRVIFEAFQQAEGGNSRNYGGTGLGLSISREIAGLLGGVIEVQSTPGVGSTFVLYLPSESSFTGSLQQRSYGAESAREASRKSPPVPARRVLDDRASIKPDERVLLIIEEDDSLARKLLDEARRRGLRGLMALNGVQGLEMAQGFIPHAISLNTRLPDMNGWVLLDRLKRDPRTIHLPVQLICEPGEALRARSRGALVHLGDTADAGAVESAMDALDRCLEKNGGREILLLGGDDFRCEEILELVQSEEVRTTSVPGAGEALELLEEREFDCLLAASERAGSDPWLALREAAPALAARRTPIIAYGEGAPARTGALGEIGRRLVLREARSRGELLELTATFLHRPVGNLPEEKLELLRRAWTRHPGLAGKKVLVVDDDVRNIFAVTAILESQGIRVCSSETGKDAIGMVAEGGIDLVLMDIMMPEMDGYEAIRRIRSEPGQAELPVIALTARAMKEDRTRCLQAGASDYIHKPVDSDQLLSLLRVWLDR